MPGNVSFGEKFLLTLFHLQRSTSEKGIHLATHVSFGSLVSITSAASSVFMDKLPQLLYLGWLSWLVLLKERWRIY